VSFARSGDVAIAHQILGAGPSDIVFVRGMTGDILSTWDQPLLPAAPNESKRPIDHRSGAFLGSPFGIETTRGGVQ
jgi:hypothetical protein